MGKTTKRWLVILLATQIIAGVMQQTEAKISQSCSTSQIKRINKKFWSYWNDSSESHELVIREAGRLFDYHYSFVQIRSDIRRLDVKMDVYNDDVYNNDRKKLQGF